MNLNLLMILLFAAMVMVLIFAPGWRRYGTEARRTCRDCGALHPAFARFCRRCGKRL